MKRNLIVFLVIALALTSLYYWRSNSYSRETLKLEIIGPDKVNIAENFEYLVKYKNNGQSRLEEPKLIFEYPAYSIVDENLLRKEISLEDIYPGEEKTYSFKVRLLGKEGEARTAKVSLSYKPKNLNARFESKTTLTTVIQSVPLTFRFDLPSEIESGKDLTFNLNYFSNIDYPLSNLRIKVDYPSGFEFVKSNPKSLESVEWDIPPLNKAEGGRIEITGRAKVNVGEESIFKAEIGSWQNGEFVLLKEVFKGVRVVKPALDISQKINGSLEYIANPGDLLHYEISFKNIGDSPLTDLSLLITLIGDNFDLTTIKALQADYNSGDNSLVWDWKKIGELQFLDIKETGNVEFWVKLKDNWAISSSTGQEVIKTNIYISQAQEEFETKVNSKMEIVQKGYFSDEIFGNSGPIPPRSSETTTYTIMWQAKNFYNDVDNVKVKAKLSDNVKLTGLIFPEEETLKFTFDSSSREVIWDVGELKVGRGTLNPAPNVAFQVSFTPNNSQIGQMPEIISSAEIIGEDGWTKETIRFSVNGLNTGSLDDIDTAGGIVQ
ncbi:MAG: hypothetical protein ABH876_01245 [Patescibacteria group bacterium]|nr:hypothetical protein [Patescibacteria group bacterium]